MIIFGYSLVPSPPRGPFQNLADGLSGRQHEPPEEAANLGHTQRDPRLRAALNAARLCGVAWGSIFFGRGSSWQVPRPHDGQQRIRPHGQGDMPIPPRPTPHLVLIQAHFAFGGFKAALNGPAGAGHLHGFCQSGRLRGKDDKGRQVRRITHTPPHQQPAAPRGLHRRGQRQPAPVIPAGAFGARPGAVPRPALRRQRGQHRFHLALLPAQPDILLARDRQDIGALLGLQPHPQPPIIAIDAVARHPGWRAPPPAKARSSMPPGQLRLRGKRRGPAESLPGCSAHDHCSTPLGRYSSRSSKAWPRALA